MTLDLRRFRSHLSIDKLYTERLLWHRWAETNSLKYLNIIDYQNKSNSSETIPWFNIPYTEKEIQKYCQLNIFIAYKSYILDKIADPDNSFVSEVIQSLLHVCNLYNAILDSSRKTSLYGDILHLLYEKHFNEPVPFFNLWNILCGHSNESKTYVLSHLLEKRYDKKSVVMLRYILNIAHAAQFNFWGVWFKRSEQDSAGFCPVTLALLKGNVDNLVLLLQYGFEQSPDRVDIYDKYYHHVENIVYAWLKAPLEERNPGRSAILTEVLLFLIVVSKTRSKSKLKSLQDCFRFLWSANSFPYVTESELVNEIFRRFRNPSNRTRSLSFPYSCKHFIRLVEYYDYVKPLGATNEIRPRSLQQFCRCAIRRTLVRSYNLPQGIEKLPLPKKVQTFLDIS